MNQNKTEKRKIFQERYLNKKVKLATKFLENSKDYFVYEGIVTGFDSNFIYLSNVKVMKNGKEELENFPNLALNKTLISYITAEV
jgi:hypothetical protein